jgi:hypothetical protein
MRGSERVQKQVKLLCFSESLPFDSHSPSLSRSLSLSCVTVTRIHHGLCSFSPPARGRRHSRLQARAPNSKQQYQSHQDQGRRQHPRRRLLPWKARRLCHKELPRQVLRQLGQGVSQSRKQWRCALHLFPQPSATSHWRTCTSHAVSQQCVNVSTRFAHTTTIDTIAIYTSVSFRVRARLLRSHELGWTQLGYMTLPLLKPSS